MNNIINPNDPTGALQRNRPTQQIPKEIVEKAEEMTCCAIIKDPVTGKEVECKGNIFVDASLLKYVSAFISPTGIPTLVNVNIGKVCFNCGKSFNADEWLKNKDIKIEGEKKDGP